MKYNMKKIVVFGGGGGLGKKLIQLLMKDYLVTSVGSNIIDITNFNELQTFLKEYNPDIVLNMAGKKYDIFLSDIEVEDGYEIDKMIDVNIKGAINILAGCLPQMIKKKYGRVIMLSSVFANMNVPTTSIYSASKAFVDRLINVANKENIKYGITCNTIQLGYWDGGMCYEIEEKYQEMAKNKIGLKRFGKIEELYNTIVYMVENEYICGTNLKIDGGI